jgi:hypothetical protein
MREEALMRATRYRATAFAALAAVLVGTLGGPAQAGAATPTGAAKPAAASITASYGPVQIFFYHSDMCLDNPGPSTANVWIDQWYCVSGATNELWYFDFVGTEGWARIRNAYSGKCLNVEGASLANGARIIQYPCLGTFPNELWKGPEMLFQIEYGPGDVRDFYQLHAKHSNMCLHIQNASTSLNAKMVQYECGTETDWYPNSYVTWRLNPPY